MGPFVLSLLLARREQSESNAASRYRGWKILHERVRYEERGPAVSTEAKKVRARKMIRELRSLGDRVELPPARSSSPA